MKTILIKIQIYYFNILRFFGYKMDESVIPKNTPYCYTIDEERNRKEPLKNGYWVKRCPYSKHLPKGQTACTYVGFSGFDPLHNDQCKICGIDDDIE